ncbi:Endonuclease/exonuclease/phosphatase [Scenedesmus sp. NREL 46B-D3]|nr:Endonuclease/exonuclease/phosphatase [Scenedesmus sp. NREL 46B-D3]
MEGVPETARGFRRQATASKGTSAAQRAAAAFTPIEGVPEKDAAFARTPFDSRMRQAQLAQQLEADLQTADEATPLAASRDAAAGAGSVDAAVVGSQGQDEDGAGVSASDMAAALHNVDSLVAGITSASPNTPLTSQLPVYLLSAGRTPAAAAAAAANTTGKPPVAPSVFRGEAAKPGHMDVAIQHTAASGKVPTAADDGVRAGDVDTTPSRPVDTAAQSAAAAMPAECPIKLTPESPRARRRTAAGQHDAATEAAAEPDSGTEAAAVCGGARASKRSYAAIATPREGRAAKSRKSLAGDGLQLAADGRRVSMRQRQKPMEFWRNERVEYARDHKSLPTVKTRGCRLQDKGFQRHGEARGRDIEDADPQRRRTKAAAEDANGLAQQQDDAAASSPKPAAKRSRTTKWVALHLQDGNGSTVWLLQSNTATGTAQDLRICDCFAASIADDGAWCAGPLYDVGMRAPRFEGAAHRFLSWNVAGFRALMKKDAEALKKLVAQEQLDAVCLQETKLQVGDVEKIVKEAGLTDWHVTFNCSTAKKGYSGTATLCRPAWAPHIVCCSEELSDVWLVNVYVPNSGEGLKRLDYRIGEWDKVFAQFPQARQLQTGKRTRRPYMQGLQHGPSGSPWWSPGDLNCAHQEIDIHNPKGNLRSAGFTQEERDSFGQQVLGHAGLVDSFRQQHPGVVGYTYYRCQLTWLTRRMTGGSYFDRAKLIAGSQHRVFSDAFCTCQQKASDGRSQMAFLQQRCTNHC